MADTAWDKLPLTERLEVWRHAILDLKAHDDPELLRSFDFDDLVNDLLKAKEAIEKGDEAAIRLGELNIIRGIPDGITQTPNSTKETRNESNTEL